MGSIAIMIGGILLLFGIAFGLDYLLSGSGYGKGKKQAELDVSEAKRDWDKQPKR